MPLYAMIPSTLSTMMVLAPPSALRPLSLKFSAYPEFDGSNLEQFKEIAKVNTRAIDAAYFTPNPEQWVRSRATGLRKAMATLSASKPFLAMPQTEKLDLIAEVQGIFTAVSSKKHDYLSIAIKISVALIPFSCLFVIVSTQYGSLMRMLGDILLLFNVGGIGLLHREREEINANHNALAQRILAFYAYTLETGDADIALRFKHDEDGEPGWAIDSSNQS